MTDQVLLKRRDAALLLGISEGLLADRARRKKGGPPFYRFTERTILYDREELLKWHKESHIIPAGMDT